MSAERFSLRMGPDVGDLTDWEKLRELLDPEILHAPGEPTGWDLISRLEAEHQRLLADNAALLAFVKEQAEVACEAYTRPGTDCGSCTTCTARALAREPHAGALLLEECNRLRADSERLAEIERRAQEKAKLVSTYLRASEPNGNGPGVRPSGLWAVVAYVLGGEVPKP